MLESKEAVTLLFRSLISTIASPFLSPTPGIIRSSLGAANFTEILCSGSILKRQEVATQINQSVFQVYSEPTLLWDYGLSNQV